MRGGPNERRNIVEFVREDHVKTKGGEEKMEKKGNRRGTRKKEKEARHKEEQEARVVAVAIDRPVIKNQLTWQLPCKSEPIKCA